METVKLNYEETLFFISAYCYDRYLELIDEKHDIFFNSIATMNELGDGNELFSLLASKRVSLGLKVKSYEYMHKETDYSFMDTVIFDSEYLNEYKDKFNPEIAEIIIENNNYPDDIRIYLSLMHGIRYE